jgi:predicted transposase/invertase (TIGR01784 family)
VDEDSKLVDWLKFLNAEEEEFKMLPEKNPMIKEAHCKLQVMSEEDANRMLYEARLKAWRDEYARIQGARQEGRQEGLREGRREALQDELRRLALNLKKMGMPAEHISQGTGLPLEEIAAL